MAKVIDSRVESRAIHQSYSIWIIFIVGLFTGVIYWYLIIAFDRYTDSIGVASNISSIIAATLGTLMILGLRMSRPLVVTVASAITLWNIISFTDGLDRLEAMIWVVGLYGLAYLLFSWLARYYKIFPVLISITTVIIIIRMVMVL